MPMPDAINRVADALFALNACAWLYLVLRVFGIIEGSRCHLYCQSKDEEDGDNA